MLYIAVSGGIDSMCLLHLFKRRRVHVLHFHHGDDHSSLASSLVHSFCSSHNIPLSIGYYPKDNPPKEALWRDARYSFFSSILTPDDSLLTAHHYTDQEVSIITNLLKHSQRGFIPPFSIRDHYPLFRPLHLIPKSQIYDFVLNHHIPFIEDPTNLPSQRGQIESLIPQLQSIIPQLKPSILKRYLSYVSSLKSQSPSLFHSFQSLEIKSL